ncbi:hypothetical protein GCM10009609_38010 [Pseudonocardia aurantiaca]|uniref:Uncharacterized protein n=1 Tax=Pseudonocardia aurantiaca TaxID=75290 RepID=A0ABW4FRL5_9PSEU
METDDLRNRWAIHGDPARLTEAAAALRSARAEQIFGASFPGEYVMSGIARLLDSIAREMHDNDTLSHDVVRAATEMSGHVLAYLPRIREATMSRPAAAGADHAQPRAEQPSDP